MMMDLVRSMTPEQMTAAYDRGALPHGMYVAALDYQRRERAARIASGKAPQELDRLTSRMTDHDEAYD